MRSLLVTAFIPFIFLVIGLTTCEKRTSDITIIENVRGYTFYDGEFEEFSSIAFQDGKVVEVAVDGPLEADPQHATVTDGDNRVMLPGLIDARGHVMGLGFNEIDVDLAGAPSLDEALERISSYASEYPELKWIRGRGWNHTRWSINRFPTTDELDQVIKDRPVWLERVDGHAGWANNKAMELAGITAENKSQEGGKIIRHDDGSPTGVFVDAAMTLIESKLPERTAGERQMALNEALQQMHSHRLTSVHDAGIETATGDLYKHFADQGNLTTRIYGMISSAGETFEDLSENGPISF